MIDSVNNIQCLTKIKKKLIIMKKEYENQMKMVPVYDKKSKTIKNRKRLLRVPVYIAKDGIKFTSKDECLDHEKYLDPNKVKCHVCKGMGSYPGEKITDYNLLIRYVHCISAGSRYYWSIPCEVCGGKGYLEKKVGSSLVNH